MRSIVVCFVAVAGIVTAETRKAIPDRYYNTFSHTNPVFLRINQGDIVVTKSSSIPAEWTIAGSPGPRAATL